MRTLFLTCIYNNLYGTEFGGRPSRNEHYKFSLLSLLRMTNADFVCYTSPSDLYSLEDFFYKQNGISKDKLRFISFNLNDTKHHYIFSKYKDIDSIKNGDRCFEIQYNKFFWFFNEKLDYDYYYWIDAGLSHCGIIPDKYLVNNNTYQRYFNSYFFDNIFLDKLIKKSRDKVLLIGKSNTGSNFWSNTIPNQYYKEYDSSYHIIGGLFGGSKIVMKRFVEEFEKVFLNVIEQEQKLYSEEQVMSLIFTNDKESFNLFSFDVWWHENNLTPDCPPNYLTINKSFYKILEDIKGE
jgi:hypothetical protein